MKKFYFSFAALSCLLLNASLSFSQINPGIPAGFAIDGDIYSGERLLGTFTPALTDDWFFKNNSGVGIIDTTGATSLKTSLATGANFVISKGMMYPKFTVQNGKLLMDARYIRDNVGLSGSIKDSTVYTNGAKNGMNPSAWGTNPSGSSVIDKTDIIDGFAHMRRDGTSQTTSDHLILTIGATTAGTSGNRFIDLELYKSKVNYDKITGAFSNSGPASTGGHTEWTFNANGTISQSGDMEFTFDYSSAAVTEIAIYVWVSKTTFQSIIPSGFSFAGGTEFYGDGNNAAYGYAKIIAKNGSSLPVWGAVNTSSTNAPVWGTISKDNGQSSLNYYSNTYAIGQFGEIGIDLTTLGIDINGFSNACATPFTRMIIKSRSSSSFTSALSDFAGPYEFMDLPLVPPTILQPANLSCSRTTVTLQPQTVATGVYTWTTTNGHISGNASGSSVVIDKPGKYYLTTAPAAGCTTQIDSVTVTSDISKPVATANRSGLITATTTAMVLGGDEAESNFSTPFGGSQGLNWSWKGPLNFSSAAKDNIVLVSGMYTLIVTERRNGCKDTAVVYIPEGAVLPMKLLNFSGADDKGKAKLKWNTAHDEDVKYYEIEKSADGNLYKKIGQVNSNGNVNGEYSFENILLTSVNFYRLKIINRDNSFTYSKVITVTAGSSEENIYMVYPNPFTDKLQLHVEANNAETVTVRLMNNLGYIFKSQTSILSKGSNNIYMNDVANLAKGTYYIQIITNEKTSIQKMIKQ